MTGPVPVRDISIVVDGVEHHGSWFAYGGTIFVRSPLGEKTTWVHASSHADSLARLLLGEMVRGMWP
jgi:hypothetical protein